MPVPRLTRLATVLALALATALTTALPASATTTHRASPGTSSLATLLAADGSGFDQNPNDFDITDHAVTAVLTAKPAAPWRCWPTARSR